MSTYITEACTNCGLCEAQCPNEAILPAGVIYVIDHELCTECVGFHRKEACQAICPVLCCLPDPDRRESEPTLLKRALKLHPTDQQLQQRAQSGDYPSRFRPAQSPPEQSRKDE